MSTACAALRIAECRRNFGPSRWATLDLIEISHFLRIRTTLPMRCTPERKANDRKSQTKNDGPDRTEYNNMGKTCLESKLIQTSQDADDQAKKAGPRVCQPEFPS
jgi:hypothetical protein